MTTITVSQQTIQTSSPRNSRRCMLFQALETVIGDRLHMVGDMNFFVLNSNDDMFLIPIPEDVKVKQQAFDEGRPVEPFSFPLDLSSIGWPV